MVKFFGICMGLMFCSLNWFWQSVFCFGLTGLILLMGVGNNLGVITFVLSDGVTFFLMGLSGWIVGLMFLMSFYVNDLKNNESMFSKLCLIMFGLLLLVFSSSNFFSFYILFEATLIPIFLLVLGWGYQPERISASYYLLFYTLGASLPLLLSIFYMNQEFKCLDFSLNLSVINKFLFWMLILAFLVKMPVYFFHLWLPKAHVEAPVAGSMVLAGVLLKLGVYGLYRVFPLMPKLLLNFSSWLGGLGLLGGFLASFICLRQIDCKSLVAYSSVAHMALVLLGLSFNSFAGLIGALIIMVAHGICSSGLFSLVGMIYVRFSSRSMILLRSSLTVFPLLGLWWFLFSIFNMAAPPSPNLAGEIYVFISSLSWFSLGALLVGLMSFLGAGYNMYMYYSLNHGSIVSESLSAEDGSFREQLVMGLHLGSLLLSLVYLLNVF